jgi:LPXTG-motif cell wall-anchored protein
MKTRIITSLGGVALVAGTVLAAPLAASAADYVPNVNGPTSNKTVVVPDDPGKVALADTGSTVPIGLIVAGGGVVVLGVSIVIVARRRRGSA